MRGTRSSSDELAEISVRLLELPSPQLKENFDPSVLDTHGRSPKPVAVLGVWFSGGCCLLMVLLTMRRTPEGILVSFAARVSENYRGSGAA